MSPMTGFVALPTHIVFCADVCTESSLNVDRWSGVASVIWA